MRWWLVSNWGHLARPVHLQIVDREMDRDLFFSLPRNGTIHEDSRRLKPRRQQVFSATRQNELRRRMPFSPVFRTRGRRDLITFRRRRRGDSDSIVGPAYDASQNPMHDADDQNDLILSARKIPKKDVHQSDCSDDHAQTKPPDNPAVNANMDVTHNSTPLAIGCIVGTPGNYCSDSICPKLKLSKCVKLNPSFSPDPSDDWKRCSRNLKIPRPLRRR